MMTITTTPEIIYLLLALFSPAPGAPGYAELFQTDDQAACEAQAADWSAKLAPTKFVCVAHAQKVIKPALKGNGNVVFFVGKTSGGAGYVKLYEVDPDDKAACDAQAKDWSTRLAPNAFVCIKHTRSKLQPGSAADD